MVWEKESNQNTTRATKFKNVKQKVRNAEDRLNISLGGVTKGEVGERQAMSKKKTPKDFPLLNKPAALRLKADTEAPK